MPQATHGANSPSFPILNLAAAIILIITNAYAVSQFLKLPSAAVRDHVYQGYLSETTNVRLPVPLREVALAFDFTTDESYGLESAEAWSSLLPPRTAGFVHLGEDDAPYSVSLYHSLHCLATIRRALSEADNVTCTYLPRTKLDAAMKHSDHCFDYLTKLLRCKADSTLEVVEHHPQVLDGRGNQSSIPEWARSGNGAVHVCHDWTQIRSFVEKNRDEKKIFPPTD